MFEPALFSIDWLIGLFVILLGCWIQTAMGFGMAVIAAPILVVLHPEWVPVLITALALLLSLFNTAEQRQHLNIKQLMLPFLTRIPGTLVGAWLLTQLDHFWLQIAVASCVLLAIAVSLAGKQFTYTPGRLSLAAFISGITGTTTSIGGPPMALVMQHGNPTEVRANLSAYFVFSCLISLICFAYLGLITENILMHILSYSPACLIGFYLGRKARPFVDAGRYRHLLLALCGLCAVIALLGASLT